MQKKKILTLLMGNIFHSKSKTTPFPPKSLLDNCEYDF